MFLQNDGIYLQVNTAFNVKDLQLQLHCHKFLKSQAEFYYSHWFYSAFISKVNLNIDGIIWIFGVDYDAQQQIQILRVFWALRKIR
jgi:hypothetical protein